MKVDHPDSEVWSFHTRLYNNLMLQNSQASSSLAVLIGQISQDAAFKEHHAANHQKGVFSLIKCTFDQMVDQLSTFSKADSFINLMQIYENLKAGAKVWAYYEYKLFAWVSLWLQLRHSITLDAVIDLDLSVLTCFFPDKPEVYLRYELFIIISRIDRFRCKWTTEEVEFFKAIVLEFLQGRRDTKRINWKYISFRLFAERSYLKTPHQCREKWMNHLNPDLNKSKWRLTEDLKLLLAYQEIGAKWSSISKRLKNRTDHMVKNRFNSLRQKWMAKQMSEKIFKINILIREVKQTIRIQQKREIASNPNYVRKYVEGKSDEDSYVLSSESEQQQVEEQSEKEVGCPMLSLADVGGFQIEKKVKEEASLDDALLKYQSKYESLLNDPLWKNEDRIPTDEYDWLDDMIEKRNVDELDEYL